MLLKKTGKGVKNKIQASLSKRFSKNKKQNTAPTTPVDNDDRSLASNLPVSSDKVDLPNDSSEKPSLDLLNIPSNTNTIPSEKKPFEKKPLGREHSKGINPTQGRKRLL